MINQIDEIETREEFVSFIEKLINDYKTNEKDWANISVEDYLEGLKSWVEDMDGYYINTNQDIPKNTDWKFIAQLLYIGKIYE